MPLSVSIFHLASFPCVTLFSASTVVFREKWGYRTRRHGGGKLLYDALPDAARGASLGVGPERETLVFSVFAPAVLFSGAIVPPRHDHFYLVLALVGFVAGRPRRACFAGPAAASRQNDGEARGAARTPFGALRSSLGRLCSCR